MSALQKNSSSKSTSKKSTSSESTGKDNGAKPKDAKGKTSVKAAAKFAGGLAIAAKGTPPEKPVKPVQPPKPKAKKTGVADAAVMNAPPATNAGANAAAPGPSATGG